MVMLNEGRTDYDDGEKETGVSKDLIRVVVSGDSTFTFCNFR
eukprot:gene10350-21589_t